MPDRLGQINRQLCCTMVIIQLQWGVQITTVGKWPSFILYHRDFNDIWSYTAATAFLDYRKDNR